MCRLAALIMLAGLCFANAAQAQDIPLETAPTRDECLLWIEPLGTTLGAIYTSGKSPDSGPSTSPSWVGWRRGWGPAPSSRECTPSSSPARGGGSTG
jgi:hypothetical protein